MDINVIKEDAVAAYGSVKALAQALRISGQAISQWQPGEPIPEKQALKLAMLRPDIFGPAPAPADKAEAA
ncbi:Cro/CI family transcriptional regulator [Lysobacter sp. GCM10012299]|uniref:Cro/CI family transcriptional regulator n=1 Tax=Lysobacter sp. GCM10012299 TaxID=3317333 RepID=UPI00361B4DA9